jgi:hypothetical protein
MDQALESNDWGTWEEFLDRLAKDFGNTEEPRRALEELGKLQQGKRMAAEYFLKFEQQANLAGIDMNCYPNATLYVKKNVQHMLINQLYQSDNLPTNYQDYRRRITTMDEMRRRREVHRAPQQTAMPRSQDINAMEVDKMTKKVERKCFVCSKEGHLARACLNKERKQDF